MIKDVPLFLFHKQSLETPVTVRDSQRNKARGQSATPASCRLLYDVKRDN